MADTGAGVYSTVKAAPPGLTPRSHPDHQCTNCARLGIQCLIFQWYQKGKSQTCWNCFVDMTLPCSTYKQLLTSPKNPTSSNGASDDKSKDEGEAPAQPDDSGNPDCNVGSFTGNQPSPPDAFCNDQPEDHNSSVRTVCRAPDTHPTC